MKRLNAAPMDAATQETAANPLESPAAFARGRRQRCTAHRSNGEPCGRWARRGMFVCATHGGRSPQAEKSARQRLFALVEPALAVFEEIVAEPPGPLNPPAVRAQAASSILDRTNLHSKSEIVMQWQAAEQAAAALGLDVEEVERLMIDPASLLPYVERIIHTVGVTWLFGAIRQICGGLEQELTELLNSASPFELSVAIPASERRETIHSVSAPSPDVLAARQREIAAGQAMRAEYLASQGLPPHSADRLPACSASNECQAEVCFVSPLDPDICRTPFPLGDSLSLGEPAAATIDPESATVDAPEPADLDERIEEFEL